MRRVFLAITLATIAGGASTSAQNATEFTIAPVGGMRFGDTRFQLNFEYLLPDSTIGSGGSELIFPLDISQTGVQLGFKVLQNGHHAWTADARVLFSVSDPGSKMTDEDWDESDFGRVEWSSTESTVEGSLTELDVEITRLFVSGKKSELAVLVGGGYQKVKQRMVDISGSQLGIDNEGNPVIYTFEDNELAGTYEIRYIRPQVGLVPRFLWGSVILEFKGVISPLLHAKDIDDHVRRFFQIRTDGKGFGYGGRAALKYQSSPTTQTRFFARLSGEISRAEVDMSGYREYYVDNPDEGVERGDRFAEEHTLSSTQYGVHLALGLTF